MATIDRRLVVLRGPAGVGKSSLAHALREELGYPTAAIDTDLFNWTIVPGESNKRVVYDHVCLLVESYLASLRAKAGLLGATYWDFYCHAPLEVATHRSASRHRDVPTDWVRRWWQDAREDVSTVPWPVHELDMQRPLTANVEHVAAMLRSGPEKP